MNILNSILMHPFTWGLALGLIFAIWAWMGGWGKRHALTKEVATLKEHLQTQMTITAKGQQSALQEIEQLKKQNENMRVTLAELKNRPDKAELQKLYVYDRAVHLMYEKAPGFSAAWESIMKEAQAEMDRTSTGLTAWVRRIIHPSLGAGAARTATDTTTEVKITEPHSEPGK